jgi:hypothetical protein
MQYTGKRVLWAYGVELRIAAAEFHFVEIPTCSASRCVQRLVDVADEMRDPFECLGTCYVYLASALYFHALNALLQDACLVGDRADHASAFCAIFVIIQTAMVGRPVVGVDPVPLVREAAGAGVCVGVGPGGGAANGGVVLGFEEGGKKGACGGSEEGFGHETYLVVDCGLLADVWLVRGAGRMEVPSAFQHSAGASHAAERRRLVDLMVSYSCSYGTREESRGSRRFVVVPA